MGCHWIWWGFERRQRSCLHYGYARSCKSSGARPAGFAGLKQEHSLTPKAMCSARDISCPVISEHRPRNKDHPQH